jgi:hypothetical protein
MTDWHEDSAARSRRLRGEKTVEQRLADVEARLDEVLEWFDRCVGLPAQPKPRQPEPWPGNGPRQTGELGPNRHPNSGWVPVSIAPLTTYGNGYVVSASSHTPVGSDIQAAFAQMEAERGPVRRAVADALIASLVSDHDPLGR